MLPLQAGLGARIADYVDNQLIPQGIDFATDAVTFVLVLAVVYVVGKAVAVPAVERVLRARGVGDTLVKPARKLTLAGVAFVGLAVAFAIAGFGNLLASVATIAAALTLAVGFASQDLIGNLVAGVFLIADPKVQIGDWVEWDGNVGVVEDISFRVSRVRTFDNELITVPNSELANTAITNPVAKDKLRIQFLFGVGYDDDIDHAKEVIVEEAEKHEEILDEPPVSVRLTELADSYVGLKSRFWIDEPDRSDFVRVRSEYVQAVKERCDAERIDMPYPHQQLTGGIEIERVESGEPAAD
ncbi:mechanosensitive ion channel family protein [Halosegnis marinus]|uniref:Mechanosensitive ion channel family protein n=1 Tax=Halosegnis marinus TaxID=3034023 RepID=A0ABD5ZKS1_9EURY|nr:mechanosensitive ion channel family protein [Halosegnis sp. DT85]